MPPFAQRVGLTLGRGRSLLHAGRSCDQVARPLLGGGAGGRYLGSIYGKAFYMPLFVYRCPTTGYRVQGFSAEDVSVNTHTYEPVACPLCKRTHQVIRLPAQSWAKSKPALPPPSSGRNLPSAQR